MFIDNNTTGELNSKTDIEKAINNIVLTEEEKAKLQLNKIISKLPKILQKLIDEAFKHKRISKEYLLSSMLFAYSNAAGLAFNIKCMNYTNYANLYFVIVGSRGDVKSPAMDLATKPIKNYDDKHYNTYLQDVKDNTNDINSIEEEINRKQLLLQDATIEATQFAHSKNPYSIGVMNDELLFLIEKMANKNSNEGSAWRTFLLQGSTNKHIDIARKTTHSYRIKQSYPTLLGSTQTQFIPKFFANGNLESGLIDRLLFTTKLTNNDKLSKGKIDPYSILKYNESVVELLDYRTAIENDMNEENPKSLNIKLTQGAENKIYEYSQKLINRQKILHDETHQYISKMQISIHKITLLIHLITNISQGEIQSEITENSVELAILLNEFYYTNFKIVLNQTNNTIDKKLVLKEIINLAKENNAEQKDVVAITGKSKGYISKLWNRE